MEYLSVTSAIVQTSGLMTEGEAETFKDDLPQLSTTPFGKSAMMKGGQTIQAWLSDNDDPVPAKLAPYVEEWPEASIGSIYKFTQAKLALLPQSQGRKTWPKP